MLNAQIAVTQAVPYIVLLIGLAIAVLTDTYISRFHKKILLLVVLLAVTLILQNVADCLLSGTPYVLIRKIVGIYGYAVRPAIIVLFYYFFNNGKRAVPAWCLVGLNAALYLTALFSPITFTYGGAHYGFVRGPLGFTAHIVGAVLLLGLFMQTIREYRNNKKELIFPILFILFISGGILIDGLSSFDDISALSALTLAIVTSCVFIYLWFHVQFVKQYQEDLITRQRIRIMVSQIQPHFLYNTIATVRALCKTDADKAALVAEKLGQYLRQNLDILDSTDLIPIEREIEHTRVYTDIETVRFENIHIEYDIKDNAFCVPPLSIQPMVENAIRHGVRIREKGVVSVSTRRLENGHEIVIRDNGTGFNENDVYSDNKKHIGIKNVRERVEKRCGGTLVIQSEPGIGTTVTIFIPETEAKP